MNRTPEQEQATQAKAVKDYAQAREIDSTALQQAIEADTNTPFDPTTYERIHKDYQHWGDSMDAVDYYSTIMMLDQFFTPDRLEFWSEEQLGFALARWSKSLLVDDHTTEQSLTYRLYIVQVLRELIHRDTCQKEKEIRSLQQVRR